MVAKPHEIGIDQAQEAIDAIDKQIRASHPKETEIFCRIKKNLPVETIRQMYAEAGWAASLPGTDEGADCRYLLLKKPKR